MNKKVALPMSFVTALLSLMIFAPASQSQAAGCVLGQYVNTTQDYARVTDVSGTCGTVGVRHKYSIASASKDYWTSWYYGADSAQTPSQPELIQTGWYHSA